MKIKKKVILQGLCLIILGMHYDSRAIEEEDVHEDLGVEATFAQKYDNEWVKKLNDIVAMIHEACATQEFNKEVHLTRKQKERLLQNLQQRINELSEMENWGLKMNNSSGAFDTFRFTEQERKALVRANAAQAQALNHVYDKHTAALRENAKYQRFLEDNLIFNENKNNEKVSTSNDQFNTLVEKQKKLRAEEDVRDQAVRNAKRAKVELDEKVRNKKMLENNLAYFGTFKVGAAETKLAIKDLYLLDSYNVAARQIFVRQLTVDQQKRIMGMEGLENLKEDIRNLQSERQQQKPLKSERIKNALSNLFSKKSESIN